MQFSDDDLIAYLLGDSSPELKKAIESTLANEADTRERVSYLRQLLGHMDDLAAAFEPPGDLVESTMARIDSVEAESSATPSIKSSQTFTRSPTSREVVGKPSSSKLFDSLALALSLALLSCLILPSIVSARFQARIAQCSSNLQALGGHIFSYAVNDPHKRIPQIGTDAHTGFAGYYPVALSTNGDRVPKSKLQCPSLLGYPGHSDMLPFSQTPIVSEFEEFSLAEIEQMKPYLGGDYAYNLGIVDGDRIVAPRWEGRFNFAIMADAPIYQEKFEKFDAHQGRGINILFGDGHVEFVRLQNSEPIISRADYPFRNVRGEHAAGLNRSDSSLAPSPVSPYGPGNENFIAE